jgi:hypothetical protein
VIRRGRILFLLACVGGCADDADGTADPQGGSGSAGDASSSGGQAPDGGWGGSGASGSGGTAGDAPVFDGDAVLIGETFVINSSSAAPSVPITGSRWTDIAFDSKNGVFLAAWSTLGSICRPLHQPGRRFSASRSSFRKRSPLLLSRSSPARVQP